MPLHLLRAPALLIALLAASGCASGSSGDEAAAAPKPAGDPSSVTAGDIQRSPNESLEEILRGRVAGVFVTRTNDGGISMRIRGGSSFQGNEEPLYLLDGVPIEPGPNGSLNINPYDIESVRVLKDPASLTMYGSRGANGVVVIKTKRARQ